MDDSLVKPASCVCGRAFSDLFCVATEYKMKDYKEIIECGLFQLNAWNCLTIYLKIKCTSQGNNNFCIPRVSKQKWINTP